MPGGRGAGGRAGGSSARVGAGGELHRLATQRAAAVGMPFFTAAILGVPDALALAIGPAWASTGPVLQLLLAAAGLHTLTHFNHAVFKACGRPDWSARLAVASTVPWSSKDMKFICPCHASVYDLRGEVVSAPAPRPLDLHHVFIENNIVKVDADKVVKRSVFRPDQVVYPKKS